jgi:hypothetical protein
MAQKWIYDIPREQAGRLIVQPSAQGVDISIELESGEVLLLTVQAGGLMVREGTRDQVADPMPRHTGRQVGSRNRTSRARASPDVLARLSREELERLVDRSEP